VSEEYQKKMQEWEDKKKRNLTKGEEIQLTKRRSHFEEPLVEFPLFVLC
jgi:hypothetical protein